MTPSRSHAAPTGDGAGSDRDRTHRDRTDSGKTGSGEPGRAEPRRSKPVRGRPETDRRPRRRAAPKEPADTLPVAVVAVDISLSHLDRPFDYLVPSDLADQARPGARVRVRFSGRLVDGFVLDRRDRSEHTGRLGYLERVVSDEPVLTPQVSALARAVADRYAGTLADVLRLAVPPRHAKAESDVPPAPEPNPPGDTFATATAPADPGGWADYPTGPAFLAAVARGAGARAVWQALPGEDWPARLAELGRAASVAGRGALLLVPDARDLARLTAALASRLPTGEFTTLSADLGPAERYRRFLRVRRGLARVVAGTRAAAFAPVADLAVLALFDDADEAFAEPRAPYPHAREVLMMRAAATGCALLVGGFSRSAEAQLLVESGWARELVARRDTVRARMPRISAQDDSFAVGADSAAAGARLSPAAFAAARRAIADDAPVLVQVPRRGYLPTMACVDCRRPARCRRCHGPLGIAAGQRIPSCRWCGAPEAHFVCGACGGNRLRSTGQGAMRTAEELGRAFPGVTLVTSAGDTVRDAIAARPAIVVATPGAEPVADNGYGAALLLDGGALLARPQLRAAEETLRRWMAVAALVRPAGRGGRVVVGADGSLPATQALIRWDPAWHAAGELADRRDLGFPPAVAMASLTGGDDTVTRALEELRLPADAEVLGPVPVEQAGDRPPRNPGVGDGGDADHQGRGDEQMRALIRVPQASRRALAAALRTMAAELSARRSGTPPRIQVDPADAL